MSERSYMVNVMSEDGKRRIGMAEVALGADGKPVYRAAALWPGPGGTRLAPGAWQIFADQLAQMRVPDEVAARAASYRKMIKRQAAERATWKADGQDL